MILPRFPSTSHTTFYNDWFTLPLHHLLNITTVYWLTVLLIMHLFASHLNWVLATALSSPLSLLRTPLSSSSLLPSFLSTLISGSYMPALHQANSVHYKCYPKVFLKSNKVFCKLHFPDIFPQPGSVETRLSTHDTNTQLAQINVFSRGFMYFPKLNPHAFPNAHVWDALNGHAPTSPCPRVGMGRWGHEECTQRLAWRVYSTTSRAHVKWRRGATLRKAHIILSHEALCACAIPVVLWPRPSQKGERARETVSLVHYVIGRCVP